MDNLKDSELIFEYLKGDDGSLEILVKRYVKPLYAFAYKYMHDEAMADDVVQETFIKAWKNIKKFDMDRSFKAWLFSIAKNTALDIIKKRSPVPFSEIEAEIGDNFFEESIPDNELLPDDFLIKDSLKKDIKNMLSRISKKYSKVLSLHYEDGLTFREIAEILGESLNTVKSRHRRALALIRRDFPGNLFVI
ncbi:MAG: RNA polymerase sigma factor [Patescibacteria group bacterium]|nr:RNA polymerase sigma factor [Patescibacteria group bacterium]